MRNLNSKFLEHTAADDTLVNCNDPVSTLDPSGIIQISMDKAVLKLIEFLKSYGMENEHPLTHRYRL